MIAARALVLLFALLGPACFSPQGATSETSEPMTNSTSTSTSTSTSSPATDTAPTTSTATSTPDTSTTSTTTSTSTTEAVSATTESTTVDATTTTTTTDGTIEPDTTSTSSSTSTGPTGECGNAVIDIGEECDDGNDIDADTCTNACTNPECGDGVLHADEECDELGDNCMGCKRQWMQVFVTSTTSDGNLDGLAGADEFCQDRAASGGVQGRFKAWLGTMQSPAMTRLQPSLRPYKRLDGAVIADSWADLTDGTALQNEIDIDENGDPAAEAVGCGECRVWTSALTNGASYSDTCNDWSIYVFQSARVGECSRKDTAWTDGCGALMCNQQARLYCLEQGLTP